MFLQSFEISPGTTVSDIVLKNHHTADVFRKYGIEYCCGGRWPLETVCIIKGLEFDALKKELEKACRVIELPAQLSFETWSVDFLTSYITHVHHYYLKKTLADTVIIIKDFAEEHLRQYPYMQEVYLLARQFEEEIIPHILQEETTIFPYICQVIHAYENKDSYARLLVKTLRKPLDAMVMQEQHLLSSFLFKIRSLTNNYSLPEKACVSHSVALHRLKELDSDLSQHVYLENEVLFPRAIMIEQELLK